MPPVSKLTVVNVLLPTSHGRSGEVDCLWAEATWRELLKKCPRLNGGQLWELCRKGWPELKLRRIRHDHPIGYLSAGFPNPVLSSQFWRAFRDNMDNHKPVAAVRCVMEFYRHNVSTFLLSDWVHEAFWQIALEDRGAAEYFLKSYW